MLEIQEHQATQTEGSERESNQHLQQQLSCKQTFQKSTRAGMYRNGMFQFPALTESYST